MSILPTLLTLDGIIYFPQSLVGRLITACAWVFFLIVILFLLRRWRGYNAHLNPRSWWMLALLAFLVPFTSLFIGLRLPASGALSPPDLPLELPDPALMLFACVPWVLASGMFGPLPGAALAAFSGLLLAYWNTQNPFTPLELALMAVLFGAAVRQRYRTRLFQLLRHPIFTTVLLSACYPIVFLISSMIAVDGGLASRLDYALTHLRTATLAMGLPLLVAGIVAEIISITLPNFWNTPGLMVPSPPEKSLQARFVYAIAPVVFFLAILLMVGDWFVSEGAARRMLRERMADAARMASEGIPYFLGAGQNLIVKIADNPQLYSPNPEDIKNSLADEYYRIPFFTQLYVLDIGGEVIASFPEDKNPQFLVNEQSGIQSALNGFPYQDTTAPPADEERAAQVSFIVPLDDESGVVRGALIGRTALEANPLSKPILAILDNLSGTDGQGILLDEEKRIIYHPDPALLLTEYTGKIPESADFFDEASPNGTRRLVYYLPALGSPWSTVITIPAQRAQQLALNIAVPLVVVMIILGLVLAFLLRFSLRSVTRSLSSLAVQANNISQGELDEPLPVSGEDEVGQLRRAFEQMRLSLKARLDELNRLLLVSQGVASTLDIGEAVRPVLEAALSTGACSARVVLAPAIIPELNGDKASPIIYRLGPAGDLYSELDEQVLNLTRQQERVLLTNPSRTRVVTFKPTTPRPKSILAVALRHENQYYGTLWTAYDQPHSFTEEEVRFLVTLAGYASLAAANTRLFLSTEGARQRLSAILASTPDPVLVTNEQNQLLLANPAAWRVLGIGVEWDEGLPIERVISQPELLRLLHTEGEEKRFAEVTLPDGRSYYATASSILADGKRIGRVCVMRDITHFKQLDSLKSDFVATVSHDLRSPLTLIRGYASMLDMVGDLNEQQTSFTHKIVSGVDDMASLVNNLLDLGRIEAGVGLQLEKVSAKEVVERAVGTLQDQAIQKRVTLSIDIPEHSLPQVEADLALLQQAIQNLVDNAIKYTEPGGQVQISVSTRQEQIIFQVRDTGIGIAPVDQARMFEKFYRGAQYTGKQPRGSGLGLAIVKSIAERHGGRVWVQSQLGKGSIFYLAIPLKNPERANVG